MLCRTKIKSFQLQKLHNYQSSTKSRMVRKAPDCKYENEECPPPRRCVPPTTVCHTLPKQNCTITIKQPLKSRKEICEPKPPPDPPCVKLPDYCATHDANSANLPWYKKVLPNEENLSPAGKMAYGFLKFNTKALIAGGSIYLTAKCGVWGTSEQTADIYRKTHHSVTSLIRCNAEKVVDVPDSREVVAACKHYWNRGVILTISSIVFIPATLKKWSKEIYKQVTDNLSPSESSKS